MKLPPTSIDLLGVKGILTRSISLAPVPKKRNEKLVTGGGGGGDGGGVDGVGLGGGEGVAVPPVLAVVVFGVLNVLGAAGLLADGLAVGAEPLVFGAWLPPPPSAAGSWLSG